MRRNIWLGLLLGLLAACLCACGQTAAEGQQTDTVIVVLSPEAEPAAGFDPISGWGAGEHVHEPLIQSTLTVTDADLQIGYDLATSLESSADGLTWTATLRDDVYFTDGEKLTAADVAFTFNTIKTSASVVDCTMLDHAEAQGELTVIFHLTRADSVWPYTLANVGIVPEHAYGPDYGQHPIGSGRYMLSQWDVGQQVILTANPDYYGGEVGMKRVVILFMAEDAALVAVRSGQVDLAYTAATYAEQEIDGYTLLACATVDNRGFNLPTVTFDGEKGNDVTADPAIRQALNLGLDRQQIIDQVLYGYGSPAYSVCDGLPWSDPDCAVAYDLAAAQEILTKAGWLPQADGVRVKDGLRAELTLLYPAGDSVRQALATQAAGQMGALGIDAAAQGVSWDVAYDLAQTTVMTWGWGAHTPMELYHLYHSGDQGLAVYTPYYNAQVDAELEAALQATDSQAANALWQAAQASAAADLPWLWLVNVDHLYWRADSLQVAAQKLHPHGHGWTILNNVDQWSWQ